MRRKDPEAPAHCTYAGFIISIKIPDVREYRQIIRVTMEQQSSTKLSRDVEDAEMNWEAEPVKQNLTVRAVEFVNRFNALSSPVSPVDTVRVLSDTKWLLETHDQQLPIISRHV